MTEPDPATVPAPDETPVAEEPVVPGLDELVEWLMSRTPSTARARLAQQVVTRVEVVRDQAIRYAWDHRLPGATLRDLATATGTSMGKVTWALGKYPRLDG
jgi:hypothetical protein